MNSANVQLIGVYSVEDNLDVSLIELIVNKNPSEFDIGEFTQKLEELPKSSWQAPFGEKYLDLKGEEIIGDYFDLPKTSEGLTRLAFFIYYLDTSKSLQTPFGEIQLTEIKNMPGKN